MTANDPQGVLVCDKPQGISSHGVVSRIRRWYGTKKVGHAGTLDPMATGVLVLGLGRGTKLLGYITGTTKTYRATIRLGSGTPTDDADSEPDVFAAPGALHDVSEDSIRAGVARLTGNIAQVPSAVSAIKVDGVRSYARVRAGEDVDLKARPVTVFRFEILDIRRGRAEQGDFRPGEDDPSSRALDPQTEFIDVDVEVDCSSGTYIRALARDLGTHLGVHGHLTALRRSRVAGFDLDSASRIPADLDTPPPPLIPLAEVARSLLPHVEIDAGGAKHLMQGKTVRLDAADLVGLRPAEGSETDSGADADRENAAGSAAQDVAVLMGDILVSIAELKHDGSLRSRTAFAIDLA